MGGVTMIGLALEGGGAKGAYQVGAYMALKKCHIKIDAVTGTSIGALNAALIAAKDESLLYYLWKDATMHELLGIDEEKIDRLSKEGLTVINIKEAFTELYKIFKNKGIDISNYRALVRNNVNENKVRKSRIKFGLTTLRLSDLEHMNVSIDQIPKGELHDYIVASAFLPVFKKEKLIDDNYYLDGGFYNLSPVDMLIDMGCKKVFVINIRGIGYRKKIKPADAEIIEIKPKKHIGYSLIFNQKTIEKNMKYGYNDTLKVLGKLDGIDYYFTKKSNSFYKRLNKKVDRDLYNAVSAILNTQSEKECIIKAVEYILKSQEKSDFIEYSIKDCIKSIQKDNTDNIIIRYVKSLNI